MTVFELTFTFFRTYLKQEKGLADNTIASYAEAVKQLLRVAADKQQLEVHKLDLASFNAKLVTQFLDLVEKKTV